MSDAESKAAELAQLALKAGMYPYERCAECEPRVAEWLKLIYWEALATGKDNASDVDPYSLRGDVIHWLRQHRAAAGHKPLLRIHTMAPLSKARD